MIRVYKTRHWQRWADKKFKWILLRYEVARRRNFSDIDENVATCSYGNKFYDCKLTLLVFLLLFLPRTDWNSMLPVATAQRWNSKCYLWLLMRSNWLLSVIRLSALISRKLFIELHKFRICFYLALPRTPYNWFNGTNSWGTSSLISRSRKRPLKFMRFPTFVHQLKINDRPVMLIVRKFVNGTLFRIILNDRF